MSNSTKGKQRLADERGFSLLQMLVTVAIISTVAGFSVFGISSARSATRLRNSARAFAQNVEKARLDAIRRHDGTNVEFTSPNTYDITMDFANNGTRQTRTFTLETNVSLIDNTGAAITASPYPYADFDWRGRTTECNMLFGMKNDRSDQLVVQVAGSGDITVNNTITTLPTVTYNNVNSTSDVSQSAALTGTDTKFNLSPCGSSSGGGGGGSGGTVPTPTVTCTAGTLTASTGYITIRRNGGSTGSVTISVTGSGTITATPDANLRATPSSQNIGSSSGGSATFAISSITRTRGNFNLKFNYGTCSPATVYVKVTN